MSKSAPSPLTLPAIAKKGQAAPAVQSIEQTPQSSQTHDSSPATDPSTQLRSSSRVRATIAVTLRLDEERYERLKTYGASRRLTNQEILTAALDRFLSDAPELGAN